MIPNELETVLRQRKAELPGQSYSASLFRDPELITRKLTEETYEVCLELGRPRRAKPGPAETRQLPPGRRGVVGRPPPGHTGLWRDRTHPLPQNRALELEPRTKSRHRTQICDILLRHNIPGPFDLTVEITRRQPPSAGR